MNKASCYWVGPKPWHQLLLLELLETRKLATKLTPYNTVAGNLYKEKKPTQYSQFNVLLIEGVLTAAALHKEGCESGITLGAQNGTFRRGRTSPQDQKLALGSTKNKFFFLYRFTLHRIHTLSPTRGVLLGCAYSMTQAGGLISTELTQTTTN